MCGHVLTNTIEVDVPVLIIICIKRYRKPYYSASRGPGPIPGNAESNLRFAHFAVSVGVSSTRNFRTKGY